MVKTIEVADILDLLEGQPQPTTSKAEFIESLADSIAATGYVPEIHVLGVKVFQIEIIQALSILRQRWLNMDESGAPPAAVAVMNGRWLVEVKKAVETDWLPDEIYMAGDHIDTDRKSLWSGFIRGKK